MSFRVNARAILQLGAELISSDGIAFYELVKNAFDARSPSVELEILARIAFDKYRLLAKEIEDAGKDQTDLSKIKKLADKIIDSLDPLAPASSFAEQIAACKTIAELRSCFEEANIILIRDTGEGMSLDDLSDAFLTIGTRSRQRLRGKSDDDRPILGEKGIGRLSVMRLGNRLKVLTSKAGERRWNSLVIDWRRFSHESDELLEHIQISPFNGPPKDNSADKGTTLTISALTSEWTEDKVRTIASEEFSRLTDPFTPANRYRVILRFNGGVIPTSSISKNLLKAAHATCKGTFSVNASKDICSVEGKIEYTLRGTKKRFVLRKVELLQIAELNSPDTLYSLGPFEFECYWYNRRILTEVEGVGDRRTVMSLVERWGGGLMLFRDGFRVNPYGNPSDDWLKLDPSALAASGYKVNRRQIIGKVDITSHDNSKLTDQTNREGLRDCPEKQALIAILNHILIETFRTYLTNIDKQLFAKEQLSFQVFEERLKKQEEDLERAVYRLARRYPKETDILLPIKQAVSQIQDMLQRAKELAQVYENRQSELVNLAGIGLLTEIIAHELNRTTIHALGLVRGIQKELNKNTKDPGLNVLEQTLKTLQTRLKILDPVSTAGRQHKEKFELVAWVREILTSHAAQFSRHNIQPNITVIPKHGTLEMYAVKGMVVQVLENLISNSVYWLDAQKKLEPSLAPRIDIVIDTRKNLLSFTDNGPGIEPERAEEVFQPFVTTKPARLGKGLGLYVAREVARYNNADLSLSEDFTVRANALNTFIFKLEQPYVNSR